MLKTLFRPFFILFITALLCAAPRPAGAQGDAHGTPGEAAHGETTSAAAPHGTAGGHGAASGEGGHGGGHKASNSPFDPHQGTWVNPIARGVLGLEKPVVTSHDGEPHNSGSLESLRYDFLFLALFIMALLAVIGTVAGKKMKLRPDGKPNSLVNSVEAAAEGYYNYLVGIMGRDLATKYTPLVATFFFTILFLNYAGLFPGLMSPTANPNIPIGLAIVAFFATHIIAIKEAGVKSWLMHFVGEPLWLVPLNLPLHLIGEIIKPLSLAIRLLGNVFGEEMVVLKLAGLGIGLLAATNLPFGIPFQLLMMMLGVMFGALQALVFSTLLAIYISILSTHHDDHDEHNAHGHVEHVRLHGHDTVVAHPSEMTVAMVAKPSEATVA